MALSSRPRFYEAYWRREGRTVPEDDPTTEDRKGLLTVALARFVAASGSGERPVTVLDAGCGGGEFTAFLKSRGFDVVGLDIAAAAIERARMLCPETRFHVGSLEEKLPFHGGEFDAIWSTEVLEHLFDVHASLSELNRVLDPGGY